MKYFTPELLQRFNSSDPKLAGEANEAWERAIVQYRRKLKRIRGRLPQSVHDYLDNYCLHDAELVLIFKHSLPILTHATVLCVRQSDHLWALQYQIAGEPIIEQSVLPDSMCSEEIRWLYDEIDILDQGNFSHEILFSNGNLIKLLFKNFMIVEGTELPGLRSRISTRRALSATLN